MGSLGVAILKKTNRLFRPKPHPFNLQNDGVQTYAQWQFGKGENTLDFYKKHTSAEEMFLDKIVLDIGCGAGGKTIYYGTLRVKAIYGLDVLGKYRPEAQALAEAKGLGEKFHFVEGDAAETAFADNTFDTILVNDAMEHVKAPGKVLEEAYRILKPGGRLYVNFPPYDHPYGAHLSDAIYIPWVHRFFRERTLIKAYRELVRDLPDGEERLAFRVGKDEKGRDCISYINKMTVKWFKRLISESDFKTVYFEVAHFSSILSKLPVARHFLVRMVVAVLEK